MILIVSSFSLAARAETPELQADALVVEGAKLGEAGRYEEAILRFKAADSLVRRTLHDCNIGLAYARLSRFPQAHYFFSRCARLSEEPLPAWVAPRVESTQAQLRAGRFAPVRVETLPAGSAVTVSVFAPDELIDTPVDLWLPLDVDVVVTASVEGRGPAEARVKMVSGSPTRVVLELSALPAAVEPAPLPAAGESAPLSPPPPPPAESTWPWLVAASGAVVGGVGGWALVSGANLAAEARVEDNRGRYDVLSERASTRWTLGWALVGVGATALVSGLYFGLTESEL